QVRAILKTVAPNAPWQYYELVGVQWPAEVNNVTAADPKTFPDNITNMSGGRPVPAFLSNSVVETYLQKGMQQPPLQFPYQGITPPGPFFMTSSCMACHSQATRW